MMVPSAPAAARKWPSGEKVKEKIAFEGSVAGWDAEEEEVDRTEPPPADLFEFTLEFL